MNERALGARAPRAIFSRLEQSIDELLEVAMGMVPIYDVEVPQLMSEAPCIELVFVGKTEIQDFPPVPLLATLDDEHEGCVTDVVGHNLFPTDTNRRSWRIDTVRDEQLGTAPAKARPKILTSRRNLDITYHLSFYELLSKLLSVKLFQQCHLILRRAYANLTQTRLLYNNL